MARQPAVQPAASPVSPLRIGLLGLGHVGREVARALLERGQELAAAADGRELQLVALGLRDPGRDRGLALPARLRRTADLAAVATDPEVDVLVELIGGLDPAGELIAAALDTGKAVVTANKALLARRGAALERLARTNRATLRFEAAVAGGVPLLAPLAGDLAANRWSALRGIVNGSTNFVLTAMATEGRSYDDAVARAKALGYLEADPTADVEGRDAADKLAILVRLAFGAWPDVAALRRSPPALEGKGPPGITGVSARLVEAARAAGLAVRLVASAAEGRGGRIEALVVPCAVPEASALGRTAGVENRLELEGRPIGRVAFSGPGAGGAATSSAVLGDLLAIARGEGSTWAGLPAAKPLPGERLSDGLAWTRRWLAVDLPGGAGVTGRATLAALRRRYGGVDRRAVLLPVLDEVS